MPDTQVKFNLWAVLAFLFLAGVSSFTFLYAEGKETKVKQQEVIQRVTKLETQYNYIIEGLRDLKISVDESSRKLETHRMKTEKGAKGNGE